MCAHSIWQLFRVICGVCVHSSVFSCSTSILIIRTGQRSPGSKWWTGTKDYHQLICHNNRVHFHSCYMHLSFKVIWFGNLACNVCKCEEKHFGLSLRNKNPYRDSYRQRIPFLASRKVLQQPVCLADFTCFHAVSPKLSLWAEPGGKPERPLFKPGSWHHFMAELH